MNVTVTAVLPKMEKERWCQEGENKKKSMALAADAAKCCKISDMFGSKGPGQSNASLTLTQTLAKTPPHDIPSMAS